MSAEIILRRLIPALMIVGTKVTEKQTHFNSTYFENRVLLKSVLGVVACVAHFITGHE